MGGLRIALGILNILACVNMLVLFGISSSWAHSVLVVFTWCLPFIVAAALTLIGGILTLKRKGWGWAITGIIVTGAGWFYFYIIALMYVFAT